MGKCNIVGGILGLGLNKFAERHGLKPLPAGTGLTYELNPGFIIKQEVKNLCGPEDEPVLRLDLKQLSAFTQAYLIDQMEDIASAQQDKAWGIPGKRVATPYVPLGAIGIPGRGTAVFWYDPDKEGIGKVNGVLLKLVLEFK